MDRVRFGRPGSGSGGLRSLLLPSDFRCRSASCFPRGGYVLSRAFGPLEDLDENANKRMQFRIMESMTINRVPEEWQLASAVTVDERPPVR